MRHRVQTNQVVRIAILGIAGIAGTVILGGCGGGNSRGGTVPTLDSGVSKTDMKMGGPADMAMGAMGDMVYTGPCDVLMQDCPDPALKCTLLQDSQMNLNPRCVPVTGMNMIDQVCKRDDGMTPGYDNCAKGFFCSSNGSLAADLMNRHCRQMCRADGDCTSAGQKCLGLTMFDGVCVPPCTVFGKGCANGYDCSVLFGDIDQMTGFASCRQPGKTAIGGACKTETDCVPGALCTDPAQGKNTKCYQLCDNNHPCMNGQCGMLMGFTGGLGYCM